jgi:hypothetical protein
MERRLSQRKNKYINTRRKGLLEEKCWLIHQSFTPETAQPREWCGERTLIDMKSSMNFHPKEKNLSKDFKHQKK